MSHGAEVDRAGLPPGAHGADYVYPPRSIPLEGGKCPFTRFFRAKRSWLDLLTLKAYGVWLGSARIWPLTSIWLVNDPDNLRRVMEERRLFPKDRRLWSLLRPLIGESIINSDGATWERQRRMIDPAFAQARLRIVFPLMLEAVAGMMERFSVRVPAGRVEVDAETTHVAADVILRTVLSLPISSDDARRIFEAFLAFTKTLATPAAHSLLRMPHWMLVLFGGGRGKRHARVIRRLLEERIRPRFDAHRAGDPGPWQDILAGLLDARDEQAGGAGFPFDELVDHVAMLFMAGHETSASAIGWAIYLLATHPQIQERVAQEVASEVGERPFEHGDLKKLRLTLDVFRETLRLYPPVGFLPREAAEETRIRSKTIAAGCPVLVSPWVVHRHRKLWKDPDAFDPDRFRRGDEAEAIAGAYLPFGMGPRVCVGAAIALQEGVLVLASLVRSFRFSALPEKVPTPFARLTVRSYHPIEVAIAPR